MQRVVDRVLLPYDSSRETLFSAYTVVAEVCMIVDRSDIIEGGIGLKSRLVLSERDRGRGGGRGRGSGYRCSASPAEGGGGYLTHNSHGVSVVSVW
jgi:hypothetical protein